MTKNIVLHGTLNLSHEKTENQRTKRQARMLGFKATCRHEIDIQNIRQCELSRLAMVD